MRILGIDPGYAIVGYGIIDADGFDMRAIDYGVVSTPSRMPFEQRLIAIYTAMKQLIDRYQPEAIAIEELFFAQNTTTAIAVAEARGVIILAAAQSNIDIFEFKPSQVKSAVTGYGQANKYQVQEMVKTLLKLIEVPKPDDAADALAVAIAQANNNIGNYGQKLRGGYQ